MTWPIYYADADLELGAVTFPPTCPALPTLRVNENQPVSYAPGWWHFPVMGIYCWQSATADGLLIMRSHSRIGAADMVARVIAASATGSDIDSAAFYADPVGESKRLLTEPGPRHWNCGPQATAMMHMLAAPYMQIPARVAQWLSATNGAHQNTEVDLDGEGRWTLYDAHFGLTYMPGFNGLELFEKARAGEDTRHYLRNWQPEATWHPSPWRAIESYEMGFGLWVPSPVVATDGGNEAQIEQMIGEETTILTPAHMRASFY